MGSLPLVSAAPAIEAAAWLVGKAVVRGKRHIDEGSPCDDACEWLGTPDGRSLAVAVCDGAGSAPRAAEGAATVARTIAPGLLELAAQLETNGPGEWLEPLVHDLIAQSREELRTRDSNIRLFNCTLVAAILGPGGGAFFHIGDGAAVAVRCAQAGTDAGMIISPPENGEYINETFFVQGDEWDKHLRATYLPAAIDAVMLMTDGAMSLVFQRRQLFLPFANPVVNRVLQMADAGERDEFLERSLASPKTYAITDDDKTLFMALRSSLLAAAPVSLSKAPATHAPPG